MTQATLRGYGPVLAAKFAPPSGGSDGVTSKALVQLDSGHVVLTSTPSTIPFSGGYFLYYDTDGYVDAANDRFVAPANDEYEVGFQVQVDAFSGAGGGGLLSVAAFVSPSHSQWTPQVTWHLPSFSGGSPRPQVVDAVSVPLMLSAGATVHFAAYTFMTGVTWDIRGGFWIRRVGSYIAL